jgi:DNA mismatch repair protein MSH6
LNNNNKAIYFEDVGKNRLNEFFNLINFLINSENYFEQIKNFIIDGNLQCKNLLEKINEIPNLSQNLFDLKENYHIVETKDEKGNLISQIESKPGVYLQYDNAKNEMNEILLEFDNILSKEKKKLKCAAIQYNHTKNFKYELEIPEEIIKKNKPNNYILTTSKKGYLRFHTQEILNNIKKLEECSEKIKELSKNLNKILFENFYSKHEILQNYIEKISEIDCLTNLAFISSFDRENFSRPKFIDIKSNGPLISLKDSIHPCLYQRSNFFVPNDIKIGSEKKNLIVITGPNMGGKSTLLRQVCITAIIAQIGCYVPAKECEMTLVDRIFTRIGASDKLFEGKSTFYVEMEETKNILQNATENSLVIMDELGRGTSTNDGKIIAKTVLFIIENRIKCRTLFTTHYHDIIEWCKNQIGIDLFFMDSNVDDKSKDITFLYKFKKGICPESFGISVAKLAGLPDEIINLAREISEINKNKRK